MNQYLIVGQLGINGIFLGAMYGIAAIGLSLIFGTMRIIFLAQGTVIVFFSFICYWLLKLVGIDPYVSLAIIIPLAALLGVGFYYGLFMKSAALEDENVSLLIAVGLMYFMETLMTVLWGGSARAVTTSYTNSVFNPFGLTVQYTRLIALLLAMIATAVVFIFLNRTRIGTAVRAASEDMISTTLMGINPNFVNAMAFALGIGLAGIAGVGVATIYAFNPTFGLTFALKALIAMTLGGIGNVWGALVGGLILGLIESFASFYVSGWTDAISFGVFLLVLYLMPQGLFGARGIIKKA